MRGEPSRSSAGVVCHLIRRADHQEVAAAADVYLRSRHAAVPAIPPLVHRDDEVRAWFADTVFPERELWVAVDTSGPVIGIMVIDGDFIDQLYVDPTRTGAGVGSKLLVEAKALRPSGLQLWTFQANEGARRFYERHAFSPVEWTDGAGNEERAPDIRYVWKPS